MCPHAGIQLEHLDRHWQDGGGTGGDRLGKQGRNPSFISFQCIIFLSLAEMVSSIWNMLIADGAFACWCLTFPLEVAHRLNYSPYLQSVWKHLLSTHTPPPSANPTSAHRILAASVWGGSGAGARRSEQGWWWGGVRASKGLIFVATVVQINCSLSIFYTSNHVIIQVTYTLFTDAAVKHGS